MVVAVAPSPPSVSPLPPCPEGSYSGTRLPTSRPILPSAASVSTTIWETRKWPPLHPTLTSGYARTQRCLPLFLPSVLLTAQPPARRPPPPRTSSCTCLSSYGLCPAAAERCWLAAILRPALRRPLDPLSPSVPRVAGPAPEWGRGRGTKLGPRRSRVREAGAEESSSVCLCLVNCASSMVQPKAGGGRGRAASAVSSPVLVPRVAPPPSLPLFWNLLPGEGWCPRPESEDTATGWRFRKGPACYVRVLLAAVVFAVFSAQKIWNHQVPDRGWKTFCPEPPPAARMWFDNSFGRNPEHTVCVCVLHSRTCNTLREGLSEVVQLQWPSTWTPVPPPLRPFLFPAECLSLPLPLSALFPASGRLAKLVTHDLAWQSYLYD